MVNGSIIQSNEVYQEEKQPLATITTNGFHHRQSRHSRQSLTYPHLMQPGDEVLWSQTRERAYLIA